MDDGGHCAYWDLLIFLCTFSQICATIQPYLMGLKTAPLVVHGLVYYGLTFTVNYQLNLPQMDWNEVAVSLQRLWIFIYILYFGFFSLFFLSFLRISSKLFSHWEVCVCKMLSWKIYFIHFGIMLWNKWSPVNTWNNHLIYFLVHYPGLRCTVIAALMSTIYHEITAGPDVYIIQNSGNYGCLVIF